MNRYTVVFAFNFIVVTLAGAQTPTQCPASGAAPQPFGPAVTAADSARLFTYTLSPDGREFFFFKKVGALDSEDYRIFRSVQGASGWSAPVQLDLGGQHSDLYPSISPDGQRLVFASYRPVPGDTSSKPNAHIWMVRRAGDGWAAPELVRASKLGHYHSGLQQDAAGNLHFRVTAPDWRSFTDRTLRWNGTSFDATSQEAPPSPAFTYWRAQSGDSLHVWSAIAGPQGIAVLPVSRVLQNRRRTPSVYYLSEPRADGWSPLTPAGALGRGSPNFLWFSTDGCYAHYTRDYSQFMRAPVSALRP